MKALVTGGYFDGGGDGVVWSIDLATERAEAVVRWTPPENLRVPTKGFAGAELAGDGTLYIAAHAAVVRVDPRAGAVTGVLHQPCMNDLHHVAVRGDRLFVSNTGLGAVDVLHIDGSFLGSYSLVPAWINARRMSGEDPPDGTLPSSPGWSGKSPHTWPPTALEDGYHAVDRTSAPFHRLKVPDHLHVNHVTLDGDRMLATCFADGSVRDLSRFEVLWLEPGAFPHDGIVHGDALWLTCIDGTVIELDRRTLVERRRVQAFATGHHGWCRGLAVTDDHLVVGLTEVRSNRLPRHRWAEHEPERSETSVLLLDRADGRLLARVDLTDATRHSKLYSVLPTTVGT